MITEKEVVKNNLEKIALWICGRQAALPKFYFENTDRIEHLHALCKNLPEKQNGQVSRSKKAVEIAKIKLLQYAHCL